MKKLASVLSLLTIALVAVPAQQFKVVTRPAVPPRETLERMNLVTAWHARLRISGQRDGLFSVQVLPAQPWPQLAVQTQGGQVALLDGETGAILWRRQVGAVGPVTQPVGANSNSIFVTRGSDLHVLNRRTGVERVYTIERNTKQVVYGTSLIALPSAAPVADEDAVYFAMSERLVAYDLPLFEVRPMAPAAAPEPAKDEAAGDVGKEEAPARPAPAVQPSVKVEASGSEPIKPVKDSLQLHFRWGYRVVDDIIHQPPLLSGKSIAAVTNGGELAILNKFEGLLAHDYRTHSHISRKAGQHTNIAYVGGDDHYVYALSLENAALLWRFLAGALLVHRPAVTDRDVFIAPGRDGLLRLVRDSGREMWRNRQVERFLAVNQKYVYAMDRHGHLYVLDGVRGTTLAKYDTQDWNLPVTNELTDRIYLAGHDGQILCLRYRANAGPVTMKSTETRRRPEPKIEEKKDEEKKDDKKEEKGAQRRPFTPVPSERILLACDGQVVPVQPPPAALGRRRADWSAP
jgi:outer membrane protein assembly factor BamB